MKYKLLSVHHCKEINIGDYIQALASSQFLPSIDGFVNREELKAYDAETCTVIMNGWFMHHPDQWPPSSHIHPLFLAFHINTLAQKDILSDKGIKYLKEHEPIGCRDMYTQRLLAQHGIISYFSGCMTLTLGYKYKIANERNAIYFVDPYFTTQWTLTTIFKNLYELGKNFKAINLIATKYPSTESWFKKRMILATFYREYSRVFSREILLRGEYICQQSSSYSKFENDTELLQEAERLVTLYAKASMVVTSRIHCALPCLGLETPVIFVENKNQTEASSCRLGGLRELFNIIVWNNDHLEVQYSQDGVINITNIPHNKNTWKGLCDKLMETTHDFFRKAKN